MAFFMKLHEFINSAAPAGLIGYTRVASSTDAIVIDKLVHVVAIATRTRKYGAPELELARAPDLCSHVPRRGRAEPTGIPVATLQA
jgi:hypothetical protein